MSVYVNDNASRGCTMLRYVNQDQTPPGGFVYKVESTGKEFQGDTLFSLQQRIIEYCEGNKLPIPVNLAGKIQDYSCRRHSALCEETDPLKEFATTLIITTRTMAAGLAVLGPWMTAGKPTVKDDLATARSATCAGCKFNVLLKNCRPCMMPAITKLVESAIGPAETPYSDQINGCNLCGCSLKIKIWVPITYIKDAMLFDKALLPDWCWVKKESDGE